MHVAHPRYASLPGWELVAAGIDDLRAGRATVEAALVLTASRRLREVGLVFPLAGPGQGSDLYDLVEARVGDRNAHGRYNALRRRLSSFLDAARAPTR
jgi:hypothetical protein